MRELFIYYRVPQVAAAAARAAVTAGQAALRARHPGLVTRLLRRPDEADPTQPGTWMETYALPVAAAGVDEAVEASIEGAMAPLRRLIDGPRHVEVFFSEVPPATVAGSAAVPPQAA